MAVDKDLDERVDERAPPSLIWGLAGWFVGVKWNDGIAS